MLEVPDLLVQVCDGGRWAGRVSLCFLALFGSTVLFVDESVDFPGHVMESVALLTDFGQDVLVHHDQCGVLFLDQSSSGVCSFISAWNFVFSSFISVSMSSQSARLLRWIFRGFWVLLISLMPISTRGCCGQIWGAEFPYG